MAPTDTGTMIGRLLFAIFIIEFGSYFSGAAGMADNGGSSSSSSSSWQFLFFISFTKRRRRRKRDIWLDILVASFTWETFQRLTK